MTKELNGNGKIVGTEIYVPHLGEVLAFSLPMNGPNYFKEVMAVIDKDKGLRPTTGQTISLIDVALKNQDEEYCEDILSEFRNNYFWTATENLWGKDDVIVYDNVDGKMPSDRESLIQMHKDGDKAVRIVPYGFKTGQQSIDELLKNEYVIAQVGDKDLLDSVKRVAKRVSKDKPYVWKFGSIKEDAKRYTTLYSDRDDNGLHFVGDYVGYDNGYASQVRNASAESMKPAKKLEAYTPKDIQKALKTLKLADLESQILETLKNKTKK